MGNSWIPDSWPRFGTSNSAFSNIISSGLLPGLIFVGWWMAANLQLVPEYLLPSPGTVWRTLLTYVLPGGAFMRDASASLTRVGAGFVLAALAGLPLGLLSGRIPLLSRLLSPVVTGLRSVPGICWLPLALVWFGIGLTTTVFLVALAAFFPIYLNAAAGAASVPQVLLRSGQMLGFSGPILFLRVILPSAMPHIRTGLRLGLGIGFAYLVLGELTGVPDGIGAMIMDARLQGRIDLVMTGILLMAAIGVLADRLLVTVLNALFRSSRRS